MARVLCIGALRKVIMSESNTVFVLIFHFVSASDEMANLLIKNGVKDVSVQDHMGKTPLYYAVLTGNSKFQEAVKHYLAFGLAATPQSHVELLMLVVGVYFRVFI